MGVFLGVDDGGDSCGVVLEEGIGGVGFRSGRVMVVIVDIVKVEG